MNEQQKFNEWMLKIKNIHYADNKQMCRAYERVEKETVLRKI